jgi:hypothetical protein
MALLKVLKKDKIAAALAPEGWYGTTISESTTGQSKSGKSTSTYVHFLVNSGEFEQKEFTVAFNDGMNSPSVLNGMQYLPFGRIMDLYRAIFGKDPDEDSEGNSLMDSDEFTGRQVDLKVHQESVEGVPTNGVLLFAPFGVGSGTKTIF